ncbi:cytidine deaminase-like isoform X2 [Convolutriloba macropyga]|uniref:cytidine deaminase-like isoform X2 n=1 Tax=Convolutriloba macropyga TaxID=536237 RepID=UPI003F528A59
MSESGSGFIVESNAEVPSDVFKLLHSRSYSPYSKFQVGSVIELDNGKLIPGCNVENASYGMTICAERSAIVSAISQGFKPEQMLTFYVITNLDYCIFPCGACRSVIAEMNPKCSVIVVNREGTTAIKSSIDQLLPGSFSSKDLDKSNQMLET